MKPEFRSTTVLFYKYTENSSKLRKSDGISDMKRSSLYSAMTSFYEIKVISSLKCRKED